MRKLTNKDIKRISLRSLPVVILAAIAFITVPSVMPESEGGMRSSVATIECGEYYEITCGGKAIAYCSDIDSDTTLTHVSEKPDSDTERKAMTCGCWINKYTFLPSCHGRILTTDPFAREDNPHPVASADVALTIERTITKAESLLEADTKKQEGLTYYLNTHSVRDDGYNTMAEYNEENKSERKRLEKSISILKGIKGRKVLGVRKKRTYTLLYQGDDGKIRRIRCNELSEESKAHDKGTIVVQTEEEFMPQHCNSVYTFKVLNVNPQKGDSITVAAVFGLTAYDKENKTMPKTSTFTGVATSAGNHDIPKLLAPNGAPLFNRHGYFIGITNDGRIAR